MSTSYQYASLTKRQWFSASALGGSGNRHGFGKNLTSRAFELLLVGIPGASAASCGIYAGCWAGDSIAIVGDNCDLWLKYDDDFDDVYADLIPMVNDYDGFEPLAEVAEECGRLYVQICHLIVTKQAIGLEAGMKLAFGANYWQRYKDLYPKLARFQLPRDLLPTAGG
jgi:hypothetical protein